MEELLCAGPSSHEGRRRVARVGTETGWICVRLERHNGMGCLYSNGEQPRDDVLQQRVVLQVVPMLMLIPKMTSDACVQAVLKDMADLSAQLPPESTGEYALLPIATLDLNIGVSLPAEELVGGLPKVLNSSLSIPEAMPRSKCSSNCIEKFNACRAQDYARTRRGYLSNVCVSSGARKQV